MRLPIHDVLPELKRALRGADCVVLEAPPGAGKTTVVPVELLGEPWLGDQRIVMLEPRRLAARRAASWMARSRGEEVGGTVGYQVRLDRRIGPRTRVEVLTEGILTRRLQSDPELAGTGLVIFDEFHERNLESDLALALCLQAREVLRDDLKLLVMSATLDGERVARLLDSGSGPAPLVRSEGRLHPVDLRYADEDPDPRRLAQAAARGVRRALRETEGNILVFLPGEGEIKRCRNLLAEGPGVGSVDLRPLYGALPKDQQDRAVSYRPRDPRAVILSTPIAESSLTIDGVRCVVDSGFRRRPAFDPGSGLSRLTTVRISRDSADQRAGRAGRLGPGVCYRLWTRGTDRGLRERLQPELLSADLAPLALQLLSWGVREPDELRWLDPVPQVPWQRALDLLRDLDAADREGRITEEGKAMAALPMHPRLAHMLHRAAGLDGGARAAKTQAAACDLAAVLDERDLLSGPARESVDLADRVEALHAYRRKQRVEGMARAACARADESARRYRRALGLKSGLPDPEHSLSVLPGLAALAYPDRTAQRRGRSTNRYLLAGGRGAELPEHSDLSRYEYLVVTSMDAGRVEGRIYTALPIDIDTLRDVQADRIESIESVTWDASEQAVAARAEKRLGALVLSSRRVKTPDPDAVSAALMEGIRSMGLAALPWKKESTHLRTRMAFVHERFPEADWPDVSDEHLLDTLETWLAPFCSGLSRASHLGRLDLITILKSMLDYRQQQELGRLAPTHFELPSGSRSRLLYEPGAAPVLAARIQQLFGLAETPSVAGGRVPVTVHLLSPASRPMQVTTDLVSFWKNTYPEVRKELKGRYPKHPWPDDPMTAPATDRAKRRNR